MVNLVSTTTVVFKTVAKNLMFLWSDIPYSSVILGFRMLVFWCC